MGINTNSKLISLTKLDKSLFFFILILILETTPQKYNNKKLIDCNSYYPTDMTELQTKCINPYLNQPGDYIKKTFLFNLNSNICVYNPSYLIFL